MKKKKNKTKADQKYQKGAIFLPKRLDKNRGFEFRILRLEDKIPKASGTKLFNKAEKCFVDGAQQTVASKFQSLEKKCIVSIRL